MASDRDFRQLIRVRYDRAGDILTFSFTAQPKPAVAEEAADDMWVRYDPDTHGVVTVDILNFADRVRTAFGPQLTYHERTDSQRLAERQPFDVLPAGNGGAQQA